jgi:AcrR family transcriptional regulator
MAESRRERKKLQTRQLLISTAFRLFAEQGYARTTIAQIAAEADVAKKTFFNHFPTKEDLLFADAELYVDAAADVIAARDPADRVSDLLLRIYQSVLTRQLAHHPQIADGQVIEIVKGAQEVPAVQARQVRVMSELQQKIGAALVAAYPDSLDPITAAAALGSLIGASGAVATISMRDGHSMAEYLAAIDRAHAIVMDGVRTL